MYKVRSKSEPSAPTFWISNPLLTLGGFRLGVFKLCIHCLDCLTLRILLSGLWIVISEILVSLRITTYLSLLRHTNIHTKTFNPL